MGTTDKQIVAHIGGKRVLVTCDEEVHQSIGEIIPKKFKSHSVRINLFLIKNFRTDSLKIDMCMCIKIYLIQHKVQSKYSYTLQRVK